MTRLHATLVALALCAAPQTANAAPSEFDRIVHAVEAQTGAHRLHLVGMGFFSRASILVARASVASDGRRGRATFRRPSSTHATSSTDSPAPHSSGL